MNRAREKQDSHSGAQRGKLSRFNRTRLRCMFHVQLTNFRCFAETKPLEVLPVTFLIGENSAGKTTFLAAVRLLLESFARSPQNPFNKDPYYLGGFDQIAHYRRGRGGRAKSFSLEITIPKDAAASGRSTRGPSVEATHKFTYVKGSPQPELSEYEFRIPTGALILNLAEKAILKVWRDGKQVFEYPLSERAPPAALLRKDPTYLRFVFAQIYF